MANKIEIEKPYIFPEEIISGLTLRNLENFPPYGFSVSKAQISTDDEIDNFRKLLAQQIGIEYNNFIFTHQTHSDKIAIIENNQKNNIDADALITNVQGLGLALSLADCCGIALYDKSKQIIAAVHSGWRGAAQKITRKTIVRMITDLNSNPNDILAYLSPCGGGNDYEVEYDVAQYFPNYVRRISEDKYLLDLGNAVLDEILSMGVPEENIEFANKSSISNPQYHSLRRDGEKSGRMALYIVMK